ncbi:hypothetical protein AWB74_03334 [Caballeronia arvi]|uniref:Uncharacterized protein n=1 Tax=Caballeronia arvi TaxID=1777135 RepID=A0A158J476_9BURK|nr:hypothetical protein AWB74_03334 [Caballeronia arvi]
MDELWVATVAGSCVLVIATMFVAGHYRRERRRRELLRQLEHDTPAALG